MTVAVLRYFNVQGRAQALRHALADAEVPFEDFRVEIGGWAPLKNNRDFAGSFGSLPTLSWDGVLVAEALPIANHIARRLGHYSAMDDARIALLEGVCSCVYLEICSRMAELLWAETLYPGVDSTKMFTRVLSRMLDKLGRVERVLPTEGWLGGERPSVADFFVAEAVELLHYVLGGDRFAALRSRLPRLVEHAEKIRMRPAIARAFETRPATFTASPTEHAGIERVRSVDLSGVGL